MAKSINQRKRNVEVRGDGVWMQEEEEEKKQKTLEEFS